MDRAEVDYLRQRFSTEVFNIHAFDSTIDFMRANPDLREIVYVENTRALDERFLRALPLCAGLCVDFAHLQDYWVLRHVPEYGFPGAPGALPDWLLPYRRRPRRALAHRWGDGLQVTIWRTFPTGVSGRIHLPPDVVSIELTNSFAEQAAVVDFILRATPHARGGATNEQRGRIRCEWSARRPPE